MRLPRWACRLATRGGRRSRSDDFYARSPLPPGSGSSVPVTFASEIGDVMISDEEAQEIRAKLLRSNLSRSVLAARAIEVAMESGGRVVLEHAERLAILEVLRKRPEPLRNRAPAG